MDEEAESLASKAVPFIAAAAGLYGRTVLSEAPRESADEVSIVGRRLLVLFFGNLPDGEPLPPPVEALVSEPQSKEAVAGVRLAAQRALSSNPALWAEVRYLLATPQGVTQFARAEGDLQVAGHNLLNFTTNNYYRGPKDGWRSISSATQALMAILSLAAAILTLRWPPFWVVSLVALAVVGAMAWVNRQPAQSWRARPSIATIGICVLTCAVLSTTFVARALSAPSPGARPQASGSSPVKAQVPGESPTPAVSSSNPSTATPATRAAASPWPTASGVVGNGPVLIESVTPMSTEDGATVATAKKIELTASQLAQLNTLNQSGFDSPTALSFLASIHAVPVGQAFTNVTVMGNDSKTVTINSMQVVKQCQAPLNGTLFENGGSGVNGTIAVGFNLDSEIDYAQNWDYGFKGNYFQEHVVTLAPGEAQTFNIQVLAGSHYCQFVFKMTIATPAGTVTEIINDDGKPFELTGGRSNAAQYSAEYIGGLDASVSFHDDPQGNYLQVNPRTGRPS